MPIFKHKIIFWMKSFALLKCILLNGFNLNDKGSCSSSVQGVLLIHILRNTGLQKAMVYVRLKCPHTKDCYIIDLYKKFPQAMNKHHENEQLNILQGITELIKQQYN